MKKNVAGQFVGAQLVSKTDGSAVTSGTTTVSVTGDAGTQATGTVGSGAATHEGNGYWTYAPAQAETNFDLVAFTFVNSSAVNATVQIYPAFPQTGDNFARLGAPVGASISADIAGVQADTDNIQTRLPAALVSGRMDASVGAMASGVLTAAAIAADAITAAKIADGAIDAATFAAGAIDAAAIAANAIGASELAADAVAEIADGILDRDMSTGTDSGSTTVRTVRQALRATRNKVSVSGSTLTVCKEDDSTASWTAAVTATAGANPITALDPAGP